MYAKKVQIESTVININFLKITNNYTRKTFTKYCFQ